MAVAFHNGTSNINASTAATSVGFATPASPTAGEIWICSALFRGGSAATITGVPASFHLIQRTDAGSGATNATVVSYWYLALGSESGTFATITISSSKYTTITDTFSGCNTTTPIVAGSVVSNGSTSAAVNIAPATFTAGQAAYVFAGSQGLTVNPSLGGSPAPTLTENNGTTGGSTATDVWANAGYSTTSGGTSWGQTNGGQASDALHSFTLDIPAASYYPFERFDTRRRGNSPVHRGAW